MKFKNWNVLVIAMLALMIWSCETNELAPVEVITDPNTPGAITNNSGLFSNNSVRERVRGFSGYNGPGGFIYSRFGSRSGRLEGGVYAEIKNGMTRGGAAARVANDSTQVDCWVESFTETENSYEFTLDFGDGCELDGEFMKGRLVEKGTFTDNTFSSEVEYFAFGGRDWEVSGTESYNGTWSEDEADSSVWESAYSFASALVESYTFENQSIEVDYKASGAERMDESSFVIEAANETVSVSTGESYESKVDSPLVMDFNCDWEQAYIFVSGIETGSYTYLDEAGETISGTYSIDYGNGSCDNLITITEDGVSEEIDLGEIWDECEGHDDDEWDDDDWDDYDYEEVVAATYVIDEAVVLSEDGTHYTAGKITLTTDSAEVASVAFKVEDDRVFAVLTDETFEESFEAEYEIATPLTSESGCEFYTAGVLNFYSEDEKIIIEFGLDGTCSNVALVTLTDYDEDDEEDNTSGD